MPEARVYTANRNYPLVRKALNASETWDWFTEYLNLWTAVDIDIKNLQDQIDALAAIIGPFTADYISLQSQNGSTTSSVQDYINDFPGRGTINYGPVVDNLDGTVTIPEGLVFASKINAPGAQKSYFTVDETIVTLTMGIPNYVVVDVSGTAPFEWAAVTNPTNYQNREDRILIDIIYYETDGTVRVTDTALGYVNFYTQFVQRAFEFADGKGYQFAERATGALIGTSGTRNTTLTTGVYWAAMQRKESAAIDTSGTDTMIRFYQDGVGGWTKQTGETQLDNQYYDDGSGTLVIMNTGRFKCVNMYILFDGDGFVELEGQAQYTSLALAEEEGRPTNVPPILASFSVYLGRYIVQQGNDTVVTESAFTTEIVGGAVTSHTSLSNLQGDPRNQHYNSTPDLSFPTAWEVVNNEWGSDSGYMRIRDLTQLRQTDAITGDAYELAASSRYLFTAHATGGLTRINRNDFSLEETNTNILSAAPITVKSATQLLQLAPTELHIVRIQTMESETVAQAHGTVLSAYTHPESGKTYCINGADNLLTISATYPYSISSTNAIAGLTNSVVAITVDQAEDFAYILDGPLTSGSMYIRKINLSTYTVTASSSAISTVNATYASIEFRGDYLAVTHDNNATANVQLCDLYDTGLTVIFNGVSTITMGHGSACCGIHYALVPGSGTFTIKVIQYPALVSRTSSHVDMSDLESSAISQLRDASNNRIVHTIADFQRASLLANNPALMNGTASQGVDGFTIENGEYSDDDFNVAFDDFRLLNADLGTNLAALGVGHCGYDRFLYFNESASDYIYKADKITGLEVASADTGVTGYGAMHRVVMGDSIVTFEGSNIYSVNPDSLETLTTTFTAGTAYATGGNSVRPAGDIAFSCNTSNTVYRVTKSGSNFSAASITAAEVTAAIGIACNTDYYYVVDSDGTIYGYDRATNTHQYTYASGITTLSFFGFHDDYLFIIGPSLLVILNYRLEQIFDDVSTFSDIRAGFVHEGILYCQDNNGPDYVPQAYLLPCLQMSSPCRIDYSELSASLSYVDGNLYSYQDWCRAARDAVTVPERTYMSAAMDEYTGFTRNDEIIMNYDPTTRTVTLTIGSGTFDMYYQGVKVIDSASSWISEAHTASPTGSLFLKYGDSGFEWTYTPWLFSEGQIAYIHVESSAGIFGIREQHGLMPWQAHREFHHVVGTYRYSGGDVASYVLASTTAANRRPTTAATLVYDEDLPSTVTAHTSESNYTQLYLTGATGALSLTAGAADIVALSGNQPYYNQWTGSTFQQTLMANNTYMNIFQLAMPVSADTDSQLYRYIYMAGQVNGTLGQAQAESIFDLSLGELGNLSPEFVFIQKITIQYASSNWTWTSTQRLEGSRAQITANPSGGWLTSVTSDKTLTGNGTAGSPLGIEPDIALVSGESYGFNESSFFSGGTGEFAVSAAVFTLIDQITNPGDSARSIVANDAYLFTYLSSSQTIYKLDRHTGAEIDSAVLTNDIGGKHAVIYGDYIYVPNTTVMIAVNIDTLIDTTITMTTTSISLRGACVNDSGTIYFANSTDVYKAVPGTSSYTVTNVVTGATSIQDIICDSDNYYVFDDAGAGIIVRRYLQSTDVLQDSSSVITGTFHGGDVSADGSIIVVSDNVVRLSASALTTVINSSSASIIAGFYGFLYHDLFYTIDTSYIYRYSLPALTATMPRVVDFTDSDAAYFKSKENDGIYSDTDFCNAVDRTLTNEIAIYDLNVNEAIDKASGYLLQNQDLLGSKVKGCHNAAYATDLVPLLQQLIKRMLPNAIDSVVTSPPTGVAEEWYLIGDSATGDFAGHDGELVRCSQIYTMPSATTDDTTYTTAMLSAVYCEEIDTILTFGIGSDDVQRKRGNTAWESLTAVLNSSKNWNYAAWSGQRRAVAVLSNDGSTAAIEMSFDGGTSWTACTTPAQTLDGLTVGGVNNDIFIATVRTGTGNDRILKNGPTDGTTWNSVTTISAMETSLYECCWVPWLGDKGGFVAIGFVTGGFFVSDENGENWRQPNTAITGSYRVTAVPWLEKVFVAGGTSGYLTRDGESYEAVTAPTANTYDRPGILLSQKRILWWSSGANASFAISETGSTGTWTTFGPTDGRTWRKAFEYKGRMIAFSQTGTYKSLTSDVDTVWDYLAPVDGMQIRESMYVYQYMYDRWVQKVDILLYATVTGDGASGTVSDIMTLDEGDTTFPTLVLNEFWDVRISITGTRTGGSTIGGGVPTSGMWVLDAAIQQGNSATTNAAYINNSTSAVSPTAVGTPYSVLQTPSIDIIETDTTGQLQITVSVVDPNATQWTFTARIEGIARTGTPAFSAA